MKLLSPHRHNGAAMLPLRSILRFAVETQDLERQNSGTLLMSCVKLLLKQRDFIGARTHDRDAGHRWWSHIPETARTNYFPCCDEILYGSNSGTKARADRNPPNTSISPRAGSKASNTEDSRARFLFTDSRQLTEREPSAGLQPSFGRSGCRGFRVLGRHPDQLGFRRWFAVGILWNECPVATARCGAV